MQSILKTIKLLSDPTRLRILLLLESDELSVAELQEILSTGQSSISTHLSQMRQAGLVEDRRTGKNVLYRLPDGPARGEGFNDLLGVARLAASEIAEAGKDSEALRLVLEKRQDKVRAYFDELAGKFGRQYVPGRSWKGLAEALLRLMPPMVVADLGAGEGTFSQLLAQRAARVIAVDNSGKMVEYGSQLAREHGLTNIEYRQGDMEALPVEDATVDLAFFSQSLHHAPHPERAVREAYRILRPGGRIAVLDLLKHHLEEARDLYADHWLGFSEVELVGFLRDAGFTMVQSEVVHREEQAPHFQTLLAVGDKPAG
ncbi:MAG: metalloregulator ArsR/SmtB family transcription factor [Bryobacteraceae bacterium]|nr:metalloregulator ArsR/SmtB family transcription factor [Bryobacteraceae bacterium]